MLPLPADVLPPGVERKLASGGARLAELPFEDLEPGEFEDFAVTLAEALYPASEGYRSGKSGHKQYGYDVTVERDDKVIVGIQCKRAQEFGPKDVEKAVAEVTKKAPTSMIFLSRAASPDARAVLKGKRGWQLWDRNKLSQAVHDKLELARSVPLVDRYFPLLRERFLGVPLPGPWLEPDQYFLRTGRREQSSHRWPLVGRDDLLGELLEFADGPASRVGALVGRGGTGKSKMLRELCLRLGQDDVAVRFLERDPLIDHRAFEQLPRGRLLVVVDDAHDADAPVGKVVTGVLAANPEANVLLALRPDGEARVRLQLRETGIDPDAHARWELSDLQVPAAEALANEVLGPEHAFAAPRLAAVARDCPFLLVTGAILVRDGQIELQRVEGDEQLRRELTESLADTISSGTTDQPEVREEVLRAVAALQPLRTADGDFRETLENLTGRAFDQLAPHLSAWEDAGILLRRGESYRVVPDLLGDALLARASRTRHAGAPTDYLERVRRAARGRALAHLIVNASRIDWQEPPTRRGQLVASLWQLVADAFQSGDAGTRIAVLEILEKVAFYQPRPSMALVRWALEHPAAPEQISSADLGLSYTFTDQDVRNAAAPVLRTAAYDRDTLREAADLLWEMARGDARPSNQHPNHPLRMLAELAEYDPRGVSAFQQALPGLVERWLRRPRREGDVHDPLCTVHPLLATEGHRQTWSSEALTFHPFLIDPDSPAVTDLRRQALDLAFAQLTLPDARRAAAAVEAIGNGITGPLGGFGLQVGERERQRWTAHFTRTLERLRETLHANPPSPVIAVALRARLQWHAEHEISEIHQATRDVLAALPREFEYELARALHGGPIDPPEDASQTADYMARHQATEQFFADRAAAMTEQPEDQVINAIERLLGDLRLALGDDAGRSRSFLWTAITTRPSLGRALCERVIEDTDGPLTAMVSIALVALGRNRDSGLIDLARRLLETGDVRVAREIAHGVGIQRARADLLEGEAPLLRTLVQHPDPDGIVPAAALGAVGFLAKDHRDVAVDLLTAVPEDRRTLALGEFAWNLGPHGTLTWHELAQQHRDGFLDALRLAPSIEEYRITEFLTLLSAQDPHALLDVLVNRVQLVEAGASPRKYTALPHSWHATLRFREREDFPDLLRRVREWLAAEPTSMWRHYLGSDLFADVAGIYDAQTRQVIEEYLVDPDEAQIRTVATMLRGAPRTLVWDFEFVRGVLRGADTLDSDGLAAVQGALYSALVTGPRRGAIGQPHPEDLEQRDKAVQLADRATPGSVEEQFYRDLAQSAEMWIDRSLAENPLPSDGRPW